MEGTHKEHTNTANLPALASHNGGSSSNTKEKHNDSGTSNEDVADDKVDASIEVLDEDEEPEYRNGVPVIKTGRDVSRFVVDIRDDGDEALTFRSILLGTAFGCMGAALYQVNSHPHYPRSKDSAMFISAHGFPPLHILRRTITHVFLSYNDVFHAVQKSQRSLFSSRFTFSNLCSSHMCPGYFYSSLYIPLGKGLRSSSLDAPGSLALGLSDSRLCSTSLILARFL